MIRKPHPQLTLLGKRTATIGGETISYTIKRSPRARHVRLEVRWESGLTVVIPRGYQPDELFNLLQEKGRWILDKLAKHGQGQAVSGQGGLKAGDIIGYLGYPLALVVGDNHKSTVTVRLEQNRLVVSLGSTGNGRLKEIVEEWYRRQAVVLIKRKAEMQGARLGVTYNRITIRGQRSRWGSCSQKGNLSFNWKLMAAPEAVVNYVVLHELAHLKEMNHSRKFWDLVAEHCPQWRQHKKWLKTHPADAMKPD